MFITVASTVSVIMQELLDCSCGRSILKPSSTLR